MKSFFNIGKRKPKGMPDIVNPVFESTGILLTKTDKYGGGFKTMGAVKLRWSDFEPMNIIDSNGDLIIRVWTKIPWLINQGVDICGERYFIKDVSPPVEVENNQKGKYNVRFK